MNGLKHSVYLKMTPNTRSLLLSPQSTKTGAKASTLSLYSAEGSSPGLHTFKASTLPSAHVIEWTFSNAVLKIADLDTNQ